MRIFAFSIFAVSLALTPVVASAENLTFTLENKSDAMIVKFYATPADGSGKRIELLNKRGLWAGKSRTLTIADGTDACVYTTRAVFEGDSYEDISDRTDFCEVGSYSIGE
jgi:hypothetical protein